MSYLACVKYGSLRLFDRLTKADVIPLTQHVRLMRYRDNGLRDDNGSNVAKNIASNR